MQRTVPILSVVLLFAVAGCLWLLAAQRRANRELRAQLALAVSGRPARVAPISYATEAASVQRISGLETTLSNTEAQLQLAQARVRDLEAGLATAVAQVVTSPAIIQPVAVPVPGPAAPGVSNAPVASPGPHMFGLLFGTNGQVLGTNLEFSAVYGRRVAFKEVGSLRRVAFDVDQLDPAVLAALGIDVEKQKALQERQERVWRQAEAASLAAAAAEERARQERRAAAEAARAEAQRQAAEQLQNLPAWDNPSPGAQLNTTPSDGQAPPADSYAPPPYPVVPYFPRPAPMMRPRFR